MSDLSVYIFTGIMLFLLGSLSVLWIIATIQLIKGSIKND
jgi:hypothetical protein